MKARMMKNNRDFKVGTLVMLIKVFDNHPKDAPPLYAVGEIIAPPVGVSISMECVAVLFPRHLSTASCKGWKVPKSQLIILTDDGDESLKGERSFVYDKEEIV